MDYFCGYMCDNTFLQVVSMPEQSSAILASLFWISLGILVMGYITYLRIVSPWFFGKRAMGIGLKPSECSLLIIGRNDPKGFDLWIRTAMVQLPEMEIVAIDNQSEDETSNHLDVLKDECPSLLVVTVPLSERFRGTRKLALTLGVKAARRANCIWVDTRCEIPSDFPLWVRTLTSPLRRGNALASFAPVLAPKKAHFAVRVRCIAVNVWAQIRAKPLIPVLRSPKTTGVIPVNFVFRKDSFFKVQGFVSSMHIDGGEAEFLLNDLAKLGPVVPVMHPNSFLFRPWVQSSDLLMRSHRSSWERMALARYGLLLALIDGAALSAGIHWLMLTKEIGRADSIAFSLENQFAISQFQAVVGLYLLLQVLLQVYITHWIHKTKSALLIALLAPLALRYQLYSKLLTFWKK